MINNNASIQFKISRVALFAGRLALLLCIFISKASAQTLPAIIPQPRLLELKEGNFSLTAKTVVKYNDCSEVAARHFLDKCAAVGLQLSMVSVVDDNIDSIYHSVITFICKLPNESIGMDGGEAYDLFITQKEIALRASYGTGLYRGIQSMLQLMPLNFHDSSAGGEYAIQCLTIRDSPAFVHRGMLMDVCRHFFSVSDVKAYIDLLAFYKMNTLHWHLTEDQGWRLAIDAYPRLTEVGAWRKEKDGSRYGGFYTKDEIREVVAYASERHIRIVPEIEMPGHSLAALAAYPSLSCTGGPHAVTNEWGVFTDIYCAGNDSVFTFLEKVLDEVMELFPSPYIHIGGDEAPKYRWDNCAKCQKRMADEGLTDTHALQSWFLNRIGRYLERHGRTMAGWDEILEGGLPKGAIVQSWQGIEGGLEAVRVGHQAIMSPTSHCYFDYDLRSIDLEKVYQFSPIPPALNASLGKYILGGECNLWSERIPDRAALDGKTFPRLLAMSEVLWTHPTKRDFEEFKSRVARHYPLLKTLGVTYGAETVPFTAATAWRNDSLLLRLTNAQPGVHLAVNGVKGPGTAQLTPNDLKVASSDGSVREIYVTPGAPRLWKVQPELDGNMPGTPIPLRLQVHKAHDARIVLNKEPNPSYATGGAAILINGILGSDDFRDGQWLGFWGHDVESVLDLGILKPVSSVVLQFLQYSNSWIFFPSAVEVFTSLDGNAWNSFGKINPTLSQKAKGTYTEGLGVRTDGKEARYVKIVATNPGNIPEWHEAAGAGSWIFISEIIVE